MSRCEALARLEEAISEEIRIRKNRGWLYAYCFHLPRVSQARVHCLKRLHFFPTIANGIAVRTTTSKLYPLTDYARRVELHNFSSNKVLTACKWINLDYFRSLGMLINDSFREIHFFVLLSVEKKRKGEKGKEKRKGKKDMAIRGKKNFVGHRI